MAGNDLFCPKRIGGKLYVLPDYNNPMEHQCEITMKRILYLLDKGVFKRWLTNASSEMDMRSTALNWNHPYGFLLRNITENKINIFIKFTYSFIYQLTYMGKFVSRNIHSQNCFDNRVNGTYRCSMPTHRCCLWYAHSLHYIQGTQLQILTHNKI